ncbi:MAG: hypothetical protein JJT96_06340 [Opitutales bacterium]|nr:hypothetical protein [Opitutales bacterium]
MTTLTGTTWDHPRGYAPLEALVPDIEARFGLRIDWTRRSLREFGDTSVTALAHRFDLLVIDHPHCGQAARDGALLALDARLSVQERADITREPIGPSLDSYQLDGRLWALPIDAAMQSASMRKGLGHPFPETWDALLKSDLRFAIPLCPTDVFCTFLTLCAQHGHPADTRGDFLRHPDLADTLARLRRLYARADPRSIDWNPIQLYEHMIRHADIDYCPLAFCYLHYADRLRFGPIPNRRHALLGGAGLAVSAHCRHPEPAIRAAAWLASGACQSGPYLDYSGQPAHGSAWKSNRPFFRDLRTTLELAYLRPRCPGWNRFQEEAGHRLHAWLQSKRSEGSIRDDFWSLFAAHVTGYQVNRGHRPRLQLPRRWHP